LQGTEVLIWLFFTKRGGKSREEIEAELVAVRRDLMDLEMHGYIPV
jgi:hypothetical protein